MVLLNIEHSIEELVQWESKARGEGRSKTSLGRTLSSPSLERHHHHQPNHLLVRVKQVLQAGAARAPHLFGGAARFRRQNLQHVGAEVEVGVGAQQLPQAGSRNAPIGALVRGRVPPTPRLAARVAVLQESLVVPQQQGFVVP